MQMPSSKFAILNGGVRVHAQQLYNDSHKIQTRQMCGTIIRWSHVYTWHESRMTFVVREPDIHPLYIALLCVKEYAGHLSFLHDCNTHNSTCAYKYNEPGIPG